MLRIHVFIVGLFVVAGCSSGGTREGVFTSLPSGELTLGVPVTWSVPLSPGTLVRTTIRDETSNLHWVRDFEAGPVSHWLPLRSGTYQIEQRIRSAQRGEHSTTTSTFVVLPRGAGGEVLPTNHPLTKAYPLTVAPGDEALVSYSCVSCAVEAKTFSTPAILGSGAQELFLLAGLRPNSEYEAHHEVRRGGDLVEAGLVVTFSTGAIEVPAFPIEVLEPAPNPAQNALLAVVPIPNAAVPSSFLWIVDELGTPVWYFPETAIVTRPTGTGWGLLRGYDAVEVIDYTGSPSRRITFGAANLQLAALSLPPITGFHHEFRPLPGNRWVALAFDERILTDIQGPGAVDVVGDVIVVFDDAMQVVWTWNSFDHLDPARLSNPEVVCTSVTPGCPILYLAEEANDWTHSNAIDYDPADGNLLLSIRHQNWVLKVRYENGAGDGGIVWRLGAEGDFTTNDPDPYPWFSYQHDSNVLSDGSLAVYDNGNLRRSLQGSGNSRGQVYSLDEMAMTAELLVNADLGVFAAALGSAALTPDGSYHFNSGFLPAGGGVFSSRHDDVAADGMRVSRFSSPTSAVYRSFRMSDPFDTSSN